MDKKKPEIRFKGFEGEWEETALGSISYKITEKNQSRKYDVVFTNSAELGVIDQRDFFDREIANTDSIQGYYVVQPNDYVYNPRISTTAPVGPINRNKLQYTGIMSPLYYVFRVDGTNMDYRYLDYFFKSAAWHPFMFQNGNSGARSDRFSISDNVFKQLPIQHPKSEEEQRKIGVLLSTIDSLINSLEQKLEKLRNIKQSLLNQMFINVNRGGQIAPLIRFKAFEEDWQMTTIGQITSIKAGQSPNCFQSGEHLYIKVDDLNSSVWCQKTSKQKVAQTCKATLVSKGSVVFPKRGAAILTNKIRVLGEDAYMDTNMMALEPEKNIEASFLYLLIENSGLYEIADTSTIPQINNKHIEPYPICITGLAEQKALSYFFITLSEQMEATHKKLSKVRTMKQGLLQKMFV